MAADDWKGTKWTLKIKQSTSIHSGRMISCHVHAKHF
ncbi:hypothetical protein COLO4_23763 [Corchorus olitorius]|uniref:Uncharacterized protein n=1 Tax=Corchorus olitorius TaxID=93759 RepID=A0A1R3IEU9_9ROSI|nr:hypothetical protein COLO4_23763 [Corchorus olitorius]